MRLSLPGLLAFLLVFPSCRRDPGEVTVYAARSLTEVLEEAAIAFSDSTKIPVALRFGSSGSLATLIGEGAPADLFVSADAAWIDRLREQRLLVDGSARVVAFNLLVTVVPKRGAAMVPREPRALLVLSRVALGDPQTVPAGRYATQALERAGAWKELESRVIFAPDVRAVLALVERGEVDAGIVYASDARASQGVEVAFAFPAESHDPIAYVAAVVAGTSREKPAREFLEYLSRSRVRGIFTAHGFGEK